VGEHLRCPEPSRFKFGCLCRSRHGADDDLIIAGGRNQPFTISRLLHGRDGASSLARLIMELSKLWITCAWCFDGRDWANQQSETHICIANCSPEIQAEIGDDLRIRMIHQKMRAFQDFATQPISPLTSSAHNPSPYRRLALRFDMCWYTVCLSALATAF
jgi:hypothetical protein